ncbi:MAG: hypothetical protein ACEPO8_06940 [Rhodothermaceae bacterium]
MKKLIIVLLLLFVIGFPETKAQSFEFGQSKGLFMGLGTGVRIPLGDFSRRHNLGIGFDVTFSYTDNNYIPGFIYTKFGYQHFPGYSGFYKKSDYTSITSDVFVINSGIRIFLPPILENVVLIMPVIEAGGTYSFYTTFHSFKAGTGKSNFTEEKSKLGFHVGGGVSIFLLDVMASYTYLNNAQYMSLDMRLRIPIYLKM